MGIIKVEVNTPVVVSHLNYADIVQGKYGPQIRFKGTIDGDTEGMVYLSVPVFKAGKALVEAGVIDYGGRFPGKDDNVGKGINLPVAVRSFTFVERKNSDDQYKVFEVTSIAGPQRGGSESNDSDLDEAIDTFFGADAAVADRLDRMFSTYSACLTFAEQENERRQLGGTPDTVVAMATTLFISANRGA